MEISSTAGIFIDIIVALILVFSLIGGLRQGALKEFFGLLAFVIALPLASLFIGVTAGWLNFIGDARWRLFLAFLLAAGIITILLQLLFWLPRHLLEKAWSGGFLWSLLGGVFGLANSALGFVFIIKLLGFYPVLPWLSDILAASRILNWLAGMLGPTVSFLMQNLLYFGALT